MTPLAPLVCRSAASTRCTRGGLWGSYLRKRAASPCPCRHSRRQGREAAITFRYAGVGAERPHLAWHALAALQGPPAVHPSASERRTRPVRELDVMTFTESTMSSKHQPPNGPPDHLGVRPTCSHTA